MKAVSLFSGAGGMDVGFSRAGFDVLWANDFNKEACATYRLNHYNPIHCGSIDDYLPQLGSQFTPGDIDCLFGGPPCQGFSVAGKMDPDDPRSQLVWSYMKAIEMIRPRCFVMENVKALACLEKFKAIREGLIQKATSLGYRVELHILNAKDFGVSQNRERMFLIGFHESFASRLPSSFQEQLDAQRKPGTLLKDLLRPLGKPLNPNNQKVCRAKITLAKNPVLRASPYAGMLFNGQGRPLNLSGYASTLPATMGGNRTPIIDEKALYEGEEPWIEHYHRQIMTTGPRIDTDTLVPSFLRRITIEEAMAIQSFPADYHFFGTQSAVFKQIGNAVPCSLAESIAHGVKGILQHLD